jgi:hypothetical protein
MSPYDILRESNVSTWNKATIFRVGMRRDWNSGPDVRLYVRLRGRKVKTGVDRSCEVVLFVQLRARFTELSPDWLSRIAPGCDDMPRGVNTERRVTGVTFTFVLQPFLWIKLLCSWNVARLVSVPFVVAFFAVFDCSWHLIFLLFVAKFSTLVLYQNSALPRFRYRRVV